MPEVSDPHNLCFTTSVRCENIVQTTRSSLTLSRYHTSTQTSISVLRMSCAPPVTIYIPRSRQSCSAVLLGSLLCPSLKSPSTPQPHSSQVTSGCSLNTGPGELMHGPRCRRVGPQRIDKSNEQSSFFFFFFFNTHTLWKFLLNQ